jgi:protein-arginine kinase activator protein McsA
MSSVRPLPERRPMDMKNIVTVKCEKCGQEFETLDTRVRLCHDCYIEEEGVNYAEFEEGF